MKRKYVMHCVIISVLLLAMTKIFTTTFPTASIGNAITTFTEEKNDALYQQIKAYSEEHTVKPIDARIDTVWKAIPGYNGLTVEIETSYKNMLVGGVFDTKELVVKETPPAIHLNDLEPSPIYRGNSEKLMVTLLINVAWGNEFIPRILQVLKESEVKATFFFDGSWVNKNLDVAMMIHLEGHEIGNHAYSHPDFKHRTRNETMNELKKTNDVIEKTLSINSIWFAPPSGSFNQETIDVAHELGMKMVLWTIDTVDWRNPATSEMVNRIVVGVENGSMVLMHPTKPVAEGLEAMIIQIKGRGFQLGTVSELMSTNRIGD